MRTRVAVIGGGPELRARRLPRLRRRRSPAALDPDGVRRRAADHRPRRHLARPRRCGRSGLSGAGAACCAAATSSSRSCTVRAARTARSPRSATSPGSPTSGPACGPGALAMDKWATKLVAGAVGIATAPGRPGHRRRRPAHGAGPHPVVVKPVAAGSSLGVSLVTEPDALAAGAATPRSRSTTGCWSRTSSSAARSTSRCCAAPDGSLLVPPALEIVTRRRCSTRARSTAAAPTSGSPRRSTRSTPRRSRTRRVATFDALGCSGVARVDFFLTDRRPGAQRGQHDAGDDRALAGAADVRRRRAAVRRPARRAGPRRPPVTPAPDDGRTMDAVADDRLARAGRPTLGLGLRRPASLGLGRGADADDLLRPSTRARRAAWSSLGDRGGRRPVPARSRRRRWPWSGRLRAVQVSAGTPAAGHRGCRSRVVAFGVRPVGQHRRRSGSAALSIPVGRGDRGASGSTRRLLRRARRRPASRRCSTRRPRCGDRLAIGRRDPGWRVLAVPWLAGPGAALLATRAEQLARRSQVTRRGRARPGRGDRRACARSRPGWPATCTTSSGTRWP